MTDERRDDWRHGVDQNLVGLNAAQRVTDQQIDDLELGYEALDKILRGDPEEEKDGLIERLHNAETKVNELRTEIFHIKNSLKDESHERWETKRTSIKSITQIIVAILTGGVLTYFWPAIHAFLMRKSNDPVEQMIERAEHPKAKHRKVVARQHEPEADSEGE